MRSFILKRGLTKILIPVLALYATPACALELIMFETKGCIWCKKWRDEIGPIYPKTEEGKFAPLRQIDMIKDAREQFKINAPITISPTFVLVSEKNEVGRIVGYPGEEFFWSLLSELIEKATVFQQKQNRTSKPIARHTDVSDTNN